MIRLQDRIEFGCLLKAYNRYYLKRTSLAPVK